MSFALVFLLSNRHSALDSTHDFFRTEYPVDSLKLFGIRIPLVAGSSPLSVKTLLFLICFALSRYSFKTQIIRYIGYAYNTDLFVSRWLISKSLEINAANLELRRNGLVYAFSQMLTQFWQSGNWRRRKLLLAILLTRQLFIVNKYCECLFTSRGSHIPYSLFHTKGRLSFISDTGMYPLKLFIVFIIPWYLFD